MPELNYRMVDTGGAGGINGGIMKPQHEGPWPGNMTSYVDVDALAAYRKKIVAAGGKIMVDDQEVPAWAASACSRIRKDACSACGKEITAASRPDRNNAAREP
jgi:predicted enzyme related to lactoylglutathione lyase